MADPQKWGLPSVVSFVIIGFLEMCMKDSDYLGAIFNILLGCFLVGFLMGMPKIDD